VGTPVSAALLASLSTFIQLIGIVAVAAPSIVGHLWPACVTGAVVIAAIALVGARSHGGASADAQAPDHEAGTASPGGIDRPFALRPALVLAAILTAALFVGRWAADTLGPDWVVVAAGAAGLADAHAGAIGPATLGDSGVITTAAALVGIATAVAANTITKLVIAVSAGGWRFAVRFAVGLVPGVAAFFAVLALTAARL
jgi:uncharacterized membrane protein (DUF4010 family)